MSFLLASPLMIQRPLLLLDLTVPYNFGTAHRMPVSEEYLATGLER